MRMNPRQIPSAPCGEDFLESNINAKTRQLDEMGVKGLKTFIESSSGNNLRFWGFRDNCLIIDGCNLYYNLYFNGLLDQTHGGDYASFEKVLWEFFEILAACDIRPFVVLDGGADHTDKKFDTLMQRKQKKIKEAHNLSVGKKGNILPILIKNMFRQVLSKLKVPLIQCLEEADWEIAALADQWNCPVLSEDSDFFIFNLRAGFLPLSHFRWKHVTVNQKTKKKYIPSRHFTARKFCQSYKMNVRILPIFACILGNDYVNLSDIRQNFSEPGTEMVQFDRILNWLSTFPEPGAAVSALIKQTRGSKKEKEELLNGISEYELKPGYLAEYFHSKDISKIAIPVHLQTLPRWILKLLLDGKMSSMIIDVVIHHRTTMTDQVEDVDLQCSSEIARPIRQVLYGLVLLTTGDQRITMKEFAGTSKCYVEEYSRTGLRVTCDRVEAIQTQAMERLCLETLDKEPKRVRLQVLLDTLGVSSEDVEVIPHDLRLQMLVTRYWLTHAEPRPCQTHLWALLLGMVYGMSSSSKKQTEMLKCPPHRRGAPLDLEAAHVYSQWQSCMKWSLCLNRLLLYHGPLVHHTLAELKSGIPLEDLLPRGSSAGHQFKELKEIILSFMGEEVRKLRTGLEHRAAERGFQGRSQELDKLSSTFRQLHLEYIRSEEDFIGERGKSKGHMTETLCAVRTRHKAKARNASNPSKKYERRCFDI
ncbi:hypothetical protein DNTS_020349 [Danionella cerebrum]|uniref:Uncharacterized protein n=1 Tax=Danionella cerebrum TaxID=2873325 RepID=A0A553MUS5_9TELE|nr:hypothetical protein DNTS_020349 [Danionella translucida]